jgi:tRNA nucleotidyltransferase/poly(A) polymerase
MPYLYTTKCSADRTIAEISKILAQNRAQKILTEYSDAGEVNALSFQIAGPHGILTFRLPCKAEKMLKVLEQDRVDKRYRTLEHANSVAWRCVKAWLEAQLALLRTEMVEFAELLLPYVQREDGKTLYEHLEESRFKGLALPAPKE